jgi:hypothetical protein
LTPQQEFFSFSFVDNTAMHQVGSKGACYQGDEMNLRKNRPKPWKKVAKNVGYLILVIPALSKQSSIGRKLAQSGQGAC